MRVRVRKKVREREREREKDFMEPDYPSLEKIKIKKPENKINNFDPINSPGGSAHFVLFFIFNSRNAGMLYVSYLILYRP